MFENELPNNSYKRQLVIIKLGIADTIRLDKDGNDSEYFKNEIRIFLSEQDKVDIEAELSDE